MHKGFWNEIDNLRQNNPDISWDYLEAFNNAAIPDLKFGPYNFLHGLCDVFAQALNEIYGYPIEYVFERKDNDQYYNYTPNLMHAYCVINHNGTSLYVDIRGITDNKNEMLEEFELSEDDIDGDYIYTYRSNQPTAPFAFASNAAYLIEAKQLINLHTDYYHIITT